MHAHDEQQVDLVEVRKHGLDGRLGVEHQTDADVAVAQLVEERARIAELDVHDAAVGAGIGEVFEQDGRVVDHQVAVEEEVGVLAQRTPPRGPMVRFGTKWPSITSTWSRSAASATRSTSARQFREVGRQDRRRQLHPAFGRARLAAGYLPPPCGALGCSDFMASRYPRIHCPRGLRSASNSRSESTETENFASG